MSTEKIPHHHEIPVIVKSMNTESRLVGAGSWEGTGVWGVGVRRGKRQLRKMKSSGDGDASDTCTTSWMYLMLTKGYTQRIRKMLVWTVPWSSPQLWRGAALWNGHCTFIWKLANLDLWSPDNLEAVHCVAQRRLALQCVLDNNFLKNAFAEGLHDSMAQELFRSSPLTYNFYF